MSQLFQINGRWVTLEKYQEIRSGVDTETKDDEPSVESKPEEKSEDSIGKMLE